MSATAGAGTLLRFAARRERVRVPVYVLTLAALVAITAIQSEALYPTVADRAEYAATVGANAGLIAMVGPPYDLMSAGGDVAWQWGGLGAVVAALMSMFIVGRHTRGEEQSGRSELVRAGVVSRRATTVVALALAAAASALAGVATTAGLLATGQPAAGSLALGASITAAGLLFAGVTAVAVQVNQGTAGAYGLVGGLVGAAYALRAAGDVGDGTLSWLSPIGWAQAMRPFAGERWWPLALFLVGAGALAPRAGPAQASRALMHPLGLAFRLQRAALAAWAAGLFTSGLSIGLTAQDAEGILGDSEQVDKLLSRAPGSLVDNYIAISLLSMALIGSGFAIQAILRMRGEEKAGRLEPLLATALSRPRWALSHLAVACAGALLLLAAAGLGAGLADAAEGGGLGRLGDIVLAAVALAPAVWVLAAAAVALFGLVPRVAGAAWGLLAACYLAAFLGPALSLPDALLDLSPFTHVPLLPAADFELVPLLALAAVAAALAAAGVVGFARRDVTP